jgi:integrase
VDVEKRKTESGKPTWRVRWRPDGAPGRRESRTFHRESDANAFAADLELRKRLGHLAGIDTGKITLDRYMAETWVPVYAADLAESTRATYRVLYAKHIGPHLGRAPLRELTPQLLARWQADRLREGAGPTSVRKSLALLGTILQTAMEGEHIAANPVRAVRKARQPRKDEVRPLAPVTVEAMRAAALSPSPTEVAPSKSGARNRKAYTVDPPGTPYTRHRDATLVSVLAYSGVRPQEALALRWGDVRDQTILIERAVSGGTIKSTKTRKARAVRLLAPLVADLREFKLASGRPAQSRLIFPGPTGDPWTKTTWDNWRERTFSRLLAAVDIEQGRPYDLRHSYASLLLHEGRSVHYVAKQLGHAARLTLDTYGHVIDELEDVPRLAAVDAILQARAGSSAQSPGRPGLTVSSR